MHLVEPLLVCAHRQPLPPPSLLLLELPSLVGEVLGLLLGWLCWVMLVRGALLLAG